ncbi:MAG TPA: TfoX/Sxy family protein [Tepidiformaceae bacterium]|nr:TfoX/Sxy family protein [Tepidiformaceae bacterium]
MVIDVALADTVRGLMAELGQEPREQRMFGGLSFMVAGNFAVAVSERGVLVRVGEAMHDEALARPGTRAMEMRGRPMRGWIYVATDRDTDTLRDWVRLGVATALAQPPRTARARKASQSAAVNPRKQAAPRRR